MIIVGINAYHGDASAAIFVDGKLIAAIEEERFTRIKHWGGFPSQSIAFCLKEVGVSFKDVDYYAIGRDPRAKFIKKLFYLISHPSGNITAIKERILNSRKVASIEKELSACSGISEKYFNNKILNVEHHRSHLASAFFASPFDEAACLSIDGSGDFTTTMLAVGKGSNIKILDSIDFPHSLGFFYTAFTQFLGFPHYGDEYKIMGMAPYGNPIYVDDLKDVILLKNNGLFSLNLKYFRKAASGIAYFDNDYRPHVATLYSDHLISKFGEPRNKEEPLTQFHKDMAASVQRMSEIVIFHILNYLQKITGLSNLCIAGGVAQNSVANGKITSNTGFKNVYIPSAGHDAGISMGSALYVQHQHLNMTRKDPIFSAYTGSKFSNDEISNWLDLKGISYSYLNDDSLFDIVTDCLIQGGVVGWMQGRAEFGPRALGGRSILADPRRQDAKEILNSKIKRRESFRPFAPSILKEYVSEYFELDEPVPFMEKVFIIRTDKRSSLPSVTHIDGTGRLQTVDRDTAPRYYALIDTFRQKTGIPVLLNTSFNENEPIVNSLEDAFNCFMRTNMDMLVMENIVIRRPQ